MAGRIPPKEHTFHHCAFPGCMTAVDEKDFCPGCNRYICDEHAVNSDAGRIGHAEIEHWEKP